MKYEVCEKKFFELIDLKEISSIKRKLRHLQTTFDTENYELDIIVNYINKNDTLLEQTYIIPVELQTSMTESLTAECSKLNYVIKENKGIEFEFFIDVTVVEILEEKEEIKESYQQELEEIFLTRETLEIEEVVPEKSLLKIDVKSDDKSFINSLKTDFVRYKILNLDDENLNKISLKYNMSINELYEMKKHGNKVIVHDKE